MKEDIKRDKNTYTHTHMKMFEYKSHNRAAEHNFENKTFGEKA